MRRRTGILHQRLPLISAALLAGSVYLVPIAAVDGAEPEITMRVLDDANDASAVLAEAAAKQAESGAKRRTAPERRAKDADEANRNDDVPDARARSIELDTVVDRDQEGESEIEDRDAPEDIDFDPTDEDEDEE
jgi:hypothetical protein